jgi:SH3-like domain-containing protein
LKLRLPQPGLLLAASLLLALAQSASALEYRSTGRAALLYDAPSTAAGKVAIAGSGLPLEVVIDTNAWVKVRDFNGHLAWIEKAALGSAKSVMIKGDVSIVRQQPRDDAGVAFRAAHGVLLEVSGPANPYGWLPVKHASGLSGWVRAEEVWGQ